MIQIRPVLGADADILFPMIFQTPVSETILWDGPESLELYQTALTERSEQHQKGEIHFFYNCHG